MTRPRYKLVRCSVDRCGCIWIADVTTESTSCRRCPAVYDTDARKALARSDDQAALRAKRRELLERQAEG